MTSTLPSFTPGEVALLISAVQEALERLQQANERVGGNDAELLEYGRQYALVLQKLETIRHSQAPSR